MRDLSEHIRGIMVQIEVLFEQIKPVIDGSLPKIKEQQLKAIEKISNHYSRLGLPLPEEFLELKESCLHDLGQIALVRRDYPPFFNFLREKLKELPLEFLKRKDGISHSEGLYLASFDPGFIKDLIEWGIFKPDTILERTYENKKYEGRIRVNGEIEVIINDVTPI